MIKFKNYIVPILISASCLSANAQLTMENMTIPKPPAYRVGISEIPEYIYVKPVEEEITKIARPKRNNLTPIIYSTYEDLTIKELSREVSQELEFDEQNMVSDLSLLWQGAAMQSDTINFALYKLANPDADKPNKNSIKNILKNVASMSALLGAGISNPLLAGTSFIGGNVLGIMSQDTKALNYKYTKVTDADMIILIRKVEDLQQNAVNLYYDYMTAKQQLQLVTKLVIDREEKYKLAQANNASREMVVITDAYYRTALDKQRTAKSNFLSKRAALEQFVGNETFSQFEQDLAQREYEAEHMPAFSESEETKQEYDRTIQDVKNFTAQQNNDSEDKIAYQEYLQDPNIDKLPELRPLPQDEDEMETTTSQLKSAEEQIDSANAIVENQKTKLSKKEQKAAKKLEQQQKKLAEKQAKEAEKAQEALNKKHDKYSTKGFIFLHDETKTGANAQTTSTESKKENNSKQENKNNNTKPAASNNKSLPSGLLPLDEIQAPVLKPGGYSIHSYSGQ